MLSCRILNIEIEVEVVSKISRDNSGMIPSQLIRFLKKNVCNCCLAEF